MRAPRVGPRELKLLTTSSARASVLLEVDRAHGDDRRVVARRADRAEDLAGLSD
jgi:hypothetical protein